jgi:hypothetical protein
MFRRRVPALVVCGLVSATLACGASTSVDAVHSTTTITLTATSCTADQLGAVLSAPFAATLVNKTSSTALFTIHRVLDGHNYSELEFFIAEQQRRFVANEQQLNPPTFTDRMSTSTVERLQTKTYEATLLSGTYGLVCREQRTPSIWPAYVIGPFRVP